MCVVETTRRGRKNSSSHRSRTSEGVLRLSCRFVSRVSCMFLVAALVRAASAMQCSKAELGRDAATALSASDGCQASVGRFYAPSVQRTAAARLTLDYGGPCSLLASVRH